MFDQREREMAWGMGHGACVVCIWAKTREKMGLSKPNKNATVHVVNVEWVKTLA